MLPGAERNTVRAHEESVQCGMRAWRRSLQVPALRAGFDDVSLLLLCLWIVPCYLLLYKVLYLFAKLGPMMMLGLGSTRARTTTQ